MDWPEFFRPQRYPEYFWEHPEHNWKAEKFGMDIQDVFTTLALQFNCTSLPLLDRDAFCRDVSYISTIAQDRDEFFQLLQEQRDTRQKELADVFVRGLQKIINNPHLIAEDHSHNWNDAMHIFHFNSFDTIVRFFANYMPDSHQGAPRLPIIPPTAATTSSIPPTDSTPPTATSTTAAASPPTIPTDPTQIQPSVYHSQETTRSRRRANNVVRHELPRLRRSTEAGSRSSGRIQKTYMDQRAPRRSSRLRLPPGTQMGTADTETSTRAATAAAAASPAPSGHKRKRDQQKDNGDLQPKKRRIDKSQPSAGAISSGKRKRELDKTQTAQQQRHGVGEDIPPVTIAGSKRKRGSDKVQTIYNQGEPTSKRRRTHTNTRPPPIHGEITANDRHEEYPPPKRMKAHAVSKPITPRITRAQWACGGNAQLFQLGQHGELKLQPAINSYWKSTSRMKRQGAAGKGIPL